MINFLKQEETMLQGLQNPGLRTLKNKYTVRFFVVYCRKASTLIHLVKKFVTHGNVLLLSNERDTVDYPTTASSISV